MADDKLAAWHRVDADVVAGSDSSCLMHLRGRAEHDGQPVRTLHLAEVLAAALPPDDGR